MAISEKKPAIALILPFIVFLIFTSLEPDSTQPWTLGGLQIDYSVCYILKLLAVGLALAVCLPELFRQFPFRWTRWSLLALGCGLAGTGIWVGLTTLQSALPGFPALEGSRSAFNPFDVFTNPTAAWGFWSVRMLGLAVIVPLMEEMFLRGFLIRWIQGENWTTLSVGDLTPKAWIAVLIYAAATHPEILAALVWFTLVTVFVRKTRNFWDAVFFHASTNAALGIFVLLSGQWSFM